MTRSGSATIDQPALVAAAKTVLDRNWIGSATSPSLGLYPHQWSWDSAFIAIGYAHYSQERAQSELLTLVDAQWENGMVPHIVFNSQSTGYFPGPEFWQTDRSPLAPTHVQTSGIIQPPNHAIAARHIYEHAADREQAQGFLEDLYPRLVAWHTYLYRERDPNQEGLVYIRHPWESGQDNSPSWDPALKAIDLTPGQVSPYVRADLEVVHSDDRPLEWAYDRYIYLVELFRHHRYEESSIRNESPFLMQDVLFNTLLVRANRDLAAIATVVGANPDDWERLADQTARALHAKTWQGDGHALYAAYDLVSEQPIYAHSAAGFTPLYAGIPGRGDAQRLVEHLDSRCFCELDASCYAVPSFDREQPAFDPKRYWRGPIWINMNWILYHGLLRYGFNEYAGKVRRAMLELPARSGFFEYFDPDTTRGHGSPDFSWTAALVIDLLAEESITSPEAA